MELVGCGSDRLIHLEIGDAARIVDVLLSALAPVVRSWLPQRVAVAVAILERQVMAGHCLLRHHFEVDSAQSR